MRAVQTLELLDIATETERLTEDQLYGAQAAALMDRLRQIPGVVGSVLISGHNPRRAICHPASINTPSKPSRRQNAPRGRR